MTSTVATAVTRNFVYSQWNGPCSSSFKPVTAQIKPSKDEIPLQLSAQILPSAKKDPRSCFTGVMRYQRNNFTESRPPLSTQEVLILAYNIISGCCALRMRIATVITRKSGPRYGWLALAASPCW